MPLKNSFLFRKNRPPLLQGLLADPWIGGFNFTELLLCCIQTAGYSGQARAEIVLAGIEDAGDLQEKIMGFVRREEPVAVEGEPEAGDAVLRELRAIRRLLEERK